eukprot:UN21076
MYHYRKNHKKNKFCFLSCCFLLDCLYQYKIQFSVFYR